ncbi:MAG: hypothetical protein MH252_17330 [Thermosynechococcaceae cyanobacterium MS004]|nr:hypothetical protein [Thermosynechococcaceae cyanobacterium MS004]
MGLSDQAISLNRWEIQGSGGSTVPPLRLTHYTNQPAQQKAITQASF